MKSRPYDLIPLVALALTACVSRSGEGVAARPCEYTATVYTAEEATPLGVSAIALLENVQPDEGATITWDDGAESRLTVTLEHVEGYGELEWKELEDGPEYCEGDHLEIPVEIRLATDDGRIDEPILGDSLVATSSTDATYYTSVYTQFIDGSMDYSAFAPPDTWDPETAEIVIDVAFSEGGSRGSFSLRTHQESGGDTYDDPPEVASW